MAKKILAVSGGIDSMLMLDLFADDDVVVAHFDHGIREDSALDAQFIENACKERGVKFISAQGWLGAGTSEEKARSARYEFFAQVQAEQGQAILYTAHHLDDLVETVAINLLRGTGWRGLAVLDSPNVRRPFLEPELLPEGMDEPPDKKAIMFYSARRHLTFREDSTNSSDEYLRNRIRHQMNNFSGKMELFRLWKKQKILKKEIDQIVEGLLPEPGFPWKRAWFNGLDEAVAIELLRAGTLRAGIRATRPQLENFRKAIIEYSPGAYFNLPKDRLVKFTKTDFWL